MIGSSGARRRGQSSPACDLAQAVPMSLFPSLEPAPGVTIPRETEVAIPRERAGVNGWAIPRKSASHRAAGTTPGKLKLSESGGGGRKSWTIRTSRESGEALRVRRSDAGYAVSLRFRDQSEEFREPYLCYLTASEWSEAKQGSLEQMARRIGEKMRRRKDASGLAGLISRLEATVMTDCGKEKHR
jgi:hypothetical protein